MHAVDSCYGVLAPKPFPQSAGLTPPPRRNNGKVRVTTHTCRGIT